MNIKITTAGYCFNNGKPDQRAGCGVALEYDDEFGRAAERFIAHPAGDSTKPKAEIQSVSLGLMCVGRKFRKICVVELRVPRYVAGLLVKDGDDFKQTPKKNVEEVEELRKWYGYYANIKVVEAKADDLAQAMTMAKECADTQEPADTGTRVLT